MTLSNLTEIVDKYKIGSYYILDYFSTKLPFVAFIVLHNLKWYQFIRRIRIRKFKRNISNHLPITVIAQVVKEEILKETLNLLEDVNGFLRIKSQSDN